MSPRLLAVAPMLDWTDRHYRFFLRQLSKHAWLYSEMITTHAILHGPQHELLRLDPSEHPISLQLGGCDPTALAKCTQLATQYNYDEINLNLGCPSCNAQEGKFGAILIQEPELIKECLIAMRAVTHLPITIKTRIGLDKQDSYSEFLNYIQKLSESGCDVFIIHARKACLNFSPKENRDIPPLNYNFVTQLKNDMPHLTLILNGGISNLLEAQDHLQSFDGVMLGRAIMNNPYLLATVDQEIYQDNYPVITREEALQNYLPYVEKELISGAHFSLLMRPVMNLFQGIPGARAWRRYLSENGHKKNAGVEVLEQAVKFIEQLCRVD